MGSMGTVCFGTVKKSMKKRVGLIVGSAVFCACRAVLAAQYVNVGFEDPCTYEQNVAVVCSEDDFNRVDTAYSSDGSLIGPNWVNAYSGDEWKVCESNLCLNAGGVPGILYNASLATQSGFGGSFLLSADVCAEVGWAGIVFNVQDASNYYVLRFKAGTRDYQLLGVQGGTNATVVKWSDASSVFAAGNFYSISVSSSEACEVDFSICDGDSVMASAGVSDSQSLFPAGYAGFYNVVTGSYDPDSRFDLFSLRVVPDEF
jgi:hypothetical protein